MNTLFTLTLLIASSNAFTLTKPSVKSWTYVGDTKPLGYFDPMQLTSKSNEEVVKYVREGELQHGRVAMLAFLSLMFSEMSTGQLGINSLSSESFMMQFPFWFSVGIFEFARMSAGWQNPFVKDGKPFKLKEDYQPGNVLNLTEEKYSESLLNKELNNGRLAMLGTLGIMAQELVNGQTVFAQ